jgi:hypothetical protein
MSILIGCVAVFLREMPFEFLERPINVSLKKLSDLSSCLCKENTLRFLWQILRFRNDFAISKQFFYFAMSTPKYWNIQSELHTGRLQSCLKNLRLDAKD